MPNFQLKVNFLFSCLSNTNSRPADVPAESEKSTNPLEHSYQETRAHFVEFLYPGQIIKGRLGLFPCVTDLMILNARFRIAQLIRRTCLETKRNLKNVGLWYLMRQRMSYW
jgi:hypothetical protein